MQHQREEESTPTPTTSNNNIIYETVVYDTTTTLFHDDVIIIITITIDDTYESIAPKYSHEAFKDLVQDIRLNGQHVPGIVNQNFVVIEGHTRYHATKELGIPFKFIVKKFKDRSEEIQFIADINDKRRHMNLYQRVVMRLNAEEELRKLAKQNMSLSLGRGIKGSRQRETLNTDKEIARKAQCSTSTVHTVRTLKDNATETLIKGLEKGLLKPTQAYNQYKKEQKRIKAEAEIKVASEGLKLPEKLILLNQDSRKVEELTEIKDNSVELVITDPPYAREYLDCYEALAKLASRKLREGGSVVFFYGKRLLPEIFEIFMKKYGFVDWHMIQVIHEGPGDIDFPMKAKIKHKSLLWFVKGAGRKRLTDSVIEDVIYSEKPDKTLHEWAQSPKEASYIIEKLTISEHSLVVDPFLGKGSFGVPAIKMNRYFIGIEIDNEKFENAQNYLKTI